MSEGSRMVKLGDGVEMPWVGLGTFRLGAKDDLPHLVHEALRLGYRLIDTAQVYRNEAMIGSVLAEVGRLGLSTSDVFVTTKLDPRAQGEAAAAAVEESLRRLGRPCVDLLLLHWPGTAPKLRPDHPRNRRLTWAVLERLKEEGKVRAIGVSNYEVRHLQEMRSYAKTMPAVNQCEFHPHYLNAELREYCSQNGIHFQAYGSLGSGEAGASVLGDAEVGAVAAEVGASPAQTLLSWARAQTMMLEGHSVIPRTSRPERLMENFRCQDTHLSEAQLLRLSALPQAPKHCWDPKDIL